MSNHASGSRGEGAPGGLVWAALGTVYVVWGSTYLAIRVAIETIPPMLMASLRFLVAGAMLYAFAIRRGDRDGDRPGRVQWGAAAIAGGLLLFGGNGLVVLAEQHIPSGVTALFVATVALWLVVLARLVLKERSTWLEHAGILLGFGGVVLLVGLPGQDLDLFGAGLAIVATLAWASGSLYSRTAPLPARPMVSTAMQMLAGGAILGVAGIARGELGEVDPAGFSLASVLALSYLIVFGSLVAFSAYVWLLRVARTSLVGTYAYVNPVVAVFLGWALLGEPITASTVVAGAVILASVAMIVSARSAGRFRAGIRSRRLMRSILLPAGTTRPRSRAVLFGAIALGVLVVAMVEALEGMAGLAALTVAFGFLGFAGWRWGYDSRDGADWRLS